MWNAHGWAELHGSFEYGPRGANERIVLACVSSGRPHCDVISERCAWTRNSGARDPTATGRVDFRKRRQQGRRLRQRHASILGSRRQHRRNPALSRIVRESPAVCANRTACQQVETNHRRQGRPDSGRPARRRLSYRRACRERCSCRRSVPANRRDTRRESRRNVRYRGGLGEPASSQRQAHRDCNECRWTRHSVHRCM